MRDRFIPDTRIHCCVFFINPTGHTLKPVSHIQPCQPSEGCSSVFATDPIAD